MILLRRGLWNRPGSGFQSTAAASAESEGNLVRNAADRPFPDEPVRVPVKSGDVRRRGRLLSHRRLDARRTDRHDRRVASSRERDDGQPRHDLPGLMALCHPFSKAIDTE